MELTNKCMVYFAMFVVFFVALISLLVGIELFYHISSYTSILNYHVISPAVATMLFGFTLASLSLLGFFGIFYHSLVLLSIFQLSLLFLLLVELIGAVVFVNLRFYTFPPVAISMLNSEVSYQLNPVVRLAWDNFQRRQTCCGTQHYSEWYQYFGNVTVPDSCCINYYVNCGHSAVVLNNTYNANCIGIVMKWLYRNDIVCALAFVSFIIVQTMTVFILRPYIRNQDQYRLLRS